MQIDKRILISVDANNSLDFTHLLRQAATTIFTTAIVNLK